MFAGDVTHHLTGFGANGYGWGAFVQAFAAGALLTMMLCIIRALEGERFKIPILGDLADRL